MRKTGFEVKKTGVYEIRTGFTKTGFGCHLTLDTLKRAPSMKEKPFDSCKLPF